MKQPRPINKKRDDKELLEAKIVIQDQIALEVETIKEKLSKIIDNPQKGSALYKRRIDKICRFVEEKLIGAVNIEKLTFCSDFYQRIEVFMNYKKRKDPDSDVTIIESDIYDIIGEVFKSFYINFLLSFLENEPNFKFPYLGRLYLKKVSRYSPVAKRVINYKVGRMILDEDFKRDLHNIEKQNKINIVADILLETKKTLTEKLYSDLIG